MAAFFPNDTQKVTLAFDDLQLVAVLKPCFPANFEQRVHHVAGVHFDVEGLWHGAGRRTGIGTGTGTGTGTDTQGWQNR